MKKKRTSTSGLFNARVLLAFALCSAGVLLATFGFTGIPRQLVGCPDGSNCEDELRDTEQPQRYMPVPGGEVDDLDRMEAEWNNRLTYPTGRFDPAWVREAAAQDASIARSIPGGLPANDLNQGNDALTLDPNSFTSLGPRPLRMTGCSNCFSYGTTEGRVNDIVIDPVTTNVAYLGSNGGGVWKTTNCCSSSTSWSAITDDPLLSTISIDSVTLDPNNHNTIYAGTGDLNFGSFSMGSQGILKSTDAGATWTLLGASVFGPGLPLPPGQFPQYQAVGKVRVDPRNSNNVVAGTKTGLYFSYDGGTNWTGPCTTNSFSTMRQDITGLALINTGSSTRIIAAVGVRGFATTVQSNLNQNGANGLYAGTLPASGCPTDFTPITTNANGWPGLNATTGTAYVNSTTGNQLGRVDIAVAPSNSNYIYAQVQSIRPNSNGGCGNTNGCQLGAYRTTDGGVTWSQIAGSPGASLTNCGGGAGDYPQNWYDQGIAVDPNNPDRVFFDTFEVWFWQNGNPVWNDTTCGYGSPNNGVHVDQHALAFVPGSSSILLAGNDGGVHGTTNAHLASLAVDPTWFNMDTGLNTIEFYSGDISGNFATSAAPQANGGAQDNGSMSVTFSGSPTGPVQWQMGRGGDGFYARIDPVGTGTSLRFWQGNNSGSLGRCISNCTASGAAWTTKTGGWSGDTQSFILPYDLFHGGIPGGDDCPAAAANGGCGHLIAGTTRVWETITGNAANSNGTVTWVVTNNPTTQNMTKQTLGNRSFINQVKYSPKYQSVAIVGTNDANVWIGFNLGTGTQAQANWVNVTGSNAILPNRPVLGIALDPTVGAANIPIGYAAVGGFNANTPSTPGHVFQVVCTTNCASFTWSDKTGNLPDIPVDSIISNPKFPQQVFAGTDWGLYYTNDITAATPTWSRFDNGLPHSMIWDMQIDRGSTTLSVWTRGRGAYVWPLPSGPGATPSPTPTATPTATATATATIPPILTPTPTPTPPTPTPTPTSTPSPIPTPTPTPGCGDTISLLPVKDNTLYEDSTGQLSNGQGIYFFDGRTGANLVRRALVAFDLSSIPTNATITGATVSLFLSQAQGGSQPVSLSAVLQDWGEGASNAGDPGGGGTQAEAGDATWLHTFYNTSFWATPGGDFSPTSSATTTVSTANTTYMWSGSGLVADVQTWVSNPAINFGWIIRGNEAIAGMTQRFNSRQNSSNQPQLMVTYQVSCVTPTPTPNPTVSISGTVLYCSNPIPGPVPNVTLTLTGSGSGSTLSDGSGNYTFSSLPSGGNYTVTPTKAARTPGSDNINTVDVIATQRHFLNLGTPLSGCRLTAADVNGDTGIDTIDVIAIQRFFLGLATGIANTGKYKFIPVSRTYTGLVTDQTAQNYDTLVFGDTAASFVELVDGPSQAQADDGTRTDEAPTTVATVALPEVAIPVHLH